MAPTKRRVEAVLGLLLGLGLVALLGAVQLVTREPGSIITGQSAAWGRSHRSAVSPAKAASERDSLFPKRKRPYNPHYDPRSRRAEQRRRAMFWH